LARLAALAALDSCRVMLGRETAEARAAAAAVERTAFMKPMRASWATSSRSPPGRKKREPWASSRL
jgi:hypothetical protein